MEHNIPELVAQLTLEEKAGLCSGADFWHTKAVERLGIPTLMVSDGPHGLRTQDPERDDPNHSRKAVCFPAGCSAAASFDPDLARRLKHSGREEQAFLTSLAGLLLVLFWIVPYIYDLFESIQNLFSL